METLTSAAIGEYGVVVATLGLVVVYLFKILEKSVKARIDALERAVTESLQRHEECERRYMQCEQRNSQLAVRVALLEGRASVAE